MRIYNYLPKKGENWWQISLLPEINILRVDYSNTDVHPKQDKYYSLSISWLFWGVGIMIYK